MIEPRFHGNPPGFYRQRGLSTAELLVVLVLVALLTLAAAPEIRRALARSKVQAAADGVTSKIRQARLLALKTRTPHRVSLVKGSGHWTLETQRRQGSSFVTLPRETLAVAPAVAVLDGSTVTRVGVSARGMCDSGRIYFGDESTSAQLAVSVEPSCAISRY